jgi:hypothetical protein
MYRLNCSTALYVLFKVTFVILQDSKSKHIYLLPYTIYLITYININQYIISPTKISQIMIQIYLNFFGNKPRQIPTLQLRQCTVGISNENPVVGMRIFLHKLDVWYQ